MSVYFMFYMKWTWIPGNNELDSTTKRKTKIPMGKKPLGMQTEGPNHY